MEHPTREEMDEYLERLEAIRAAVKRGEDTEAMGKELTAFMLKAGFGEECPVDDAGEPL